MPFTNPDTISNPTTAQPILAAWGDAVDDALDYLAQDFPHCSIFESTAQSTTTAVEADLTSNEENSDIGGMHSTTVNTERITIPAGEGGLYRLSATVEFASNATGYRFVAFRKNGATNYNVALSPAANGNATIVSGSRSLVLAAGDYITLRVMQTSGGALNVVMTDFSVEWRAVA